MLPRCRGLASIRCPGRYKSLIEIKARKWIGKGLAPFLRCDMMVGTQCPPGTFQPVLAEHRQCAAVCQHNTAWRNRTVKLGGIANRLRYQFMERYWIQNANLRFPVDTGKHRVGVEPTKQPHFKRNFRLNQFIQSEGTALMSNHEH